jgi:hypothetical protein
MKPFEVNEKRQHWRIAALKEVTGAALDGTRDALIAA